MRVELGGNVLYVTSNYLKASNAADVLFSYVLMAFLMQLVLLKLTAFCRT